MAQYLEPPPDVLSSSSVYQSVYGYLIEEVYERIPRLPEPFTYQPDNGLGLIDEFINESRFDLRLYGTDVEIASHAHRFRQFTQSHRYLETGSDPYCASATIYDGLIVGEKWISKQDIYIILQNMALAIVSDPTDYQTRQAISHSLKLLETENLDNLEFVPFRHSDFDEIEKEMRLSLKNVIHGRKAINKMADDYEKHIEDLDGFFEHFPYLTKADSNQIKSHWKKKDIGEQRIEYLASLMNGTLIMKFFRSQIKKFPELLLANSEIRNPEKQSPITCRLFEEGEKWRVVMLSELVLANNRLDSRDNRSQYQDGPHVLTRDMKDLKTHYSQYIHKIKFIRTPIKRIKHRAVPIKGLAKDLFCVPAVDVLTETFLRPMIHGYRYFQNNSDPNWDGMNGLFKHFFNADKDTYFMNSDTINKIKSDLTAIMADQFGFTKELIREVDDDGFTLKMLVQELKHLQLHIAFPDICDYAEPVYMKVNSKKMREKLRTCDMFDAVEECQVLCIVNKVTNMSSFIHRQIKCRNPTCTCRETAAASTGSAPSPLNALPPPFGFAQGQHVRHMIGGVVVLAVLAPIIWQIIS